MTLEFTGATPGKDCEHLDRRVTQPITFLPRLSPRDLKRQLFDQRITHVDGLKPCRLMDGGFKREDAEDLSKNLSHLS
jgi:hypothetical protein